MTRSTSISAVHDRIVGSTLGVGFSVSTDFQSISNASPFNYSFTPTVTGNYDFVVKAGSFVTGGGGALRLVYRVSVNPPVIPTSYFGDVFNSDPNTAWVVPPNAAQSIVNDVVMGSATLTAGVTYYGSLGGGGGTTGGSACVDVILN